MKPSCPRCGSRESVPCSEWLEASDERVQATHECSECHTRYRFTPPDRPFNPPRLSKKEIA